jgi:hypothetical protein
MYYRLLLYRFHRLLSLQDRRTLLVRLLLLVYLLLLLLHRFRLHRVLYNPRIALLLHILHLFLLVLLFYALLLSVLLLLGQLLLLLLDGHIGSSLLLGDVFDLLLQVLPVLELLCQSFLLLVPLLTFFVYQSYLSLQQLGHRLGVLLEDYSRFRLSHVKKQTVNTSFRGNNTRHSPSPRKWCRSCPSPSRTRTGWPRSPCACGCVSSDRSLEV